MARDTLAELTRLPEAAAVQRFFDQANGGVLRWALVLALPGAISAFGIALSSGDTQRALLWGLGALISLTLVAGRKVRLIAENARGLLIAFLGVHFAAAVFSFPAVDPQPAFVFSGFFFPLGLMLFRMRWNEYAVIQIGLIAAATWFAGRIGWESDIWIGLVFSGLFVWMVTVLAIRITRRHRDDFLAEWRSEVARNQEEKRMRGELMDARAIQLSMLPRTTPEFEWVDASGLSIPASEVGGDYYEYFPIDADRLALVIGDVAGHGVASGLVLSGVKSSLYLLSEELVRPVKVIERLNRMVRDTAPGRMFVTLQIALIDRRDESVVLASAGHPPFVHVSGETGRAGFVGSSGLPLGTRLEPDFSEVRQQIGAGDLLLFYTDGVIEASNLKGRAFGDERLLIESEKAARADSAREARDSVVRAISTFKGDAVQQDDQTLVALKVRSSRTG